MSLRRVVVIGSGLSGSMAAIELTARGVPVVVVSEQTPLRSPSAWRPEAFTWSTRQNDSERSSADELPLDRAARDALPGLLDQLAAYGVPFLPDTATAPLPRPGVPEDSTKRIGVAGQTAHFVARALDEQLNRLSCLPAQDARGMAVPGETQLERVCGFTAVGLQQGEDGRVSGVAGVDRRSGRVRTLPASAVILCSGGLTGLVGPTHGQQNPAGLGLWAARRAGARTVALDRFNWSALTIPGRSSRVTLPQELLDLGAELWVSSASDGDVASIGMDQRTQLHDSRRPLAPDALARSLAERSEESKLPCGNKKPVAYLDLRHLSSNRLATCEASLATIERVLGVDPRHEPVPVCAGVADSCGGLWVDVEVGSTGQLADSPRSFSTSVDGLYAAGSAAACDAAAHLGRAPLLRRLFTGRRAAIGAAAHAEQSQPEATAPREEFGPLFERLAIATTCLDNALVLNREVSALLDRHLQPGGLSEAERFDEQLGQLEQRALAAREFDGPTELPFPEASLRLEARLVLARAMTPEAPDG